MSRSTHTDDADNEGDELPSGVNVVDARDGIEGQRQLNGDDAPYHD